MELKENKKRGRPVGSIVRQRIANILFICKNLYGYEIYKIYCDNFPKVSMRLIYYHLKKGVSTNEFLIHKIYKKKGRFSWGENSKNILYKLGPEAKPFLDSNLKKYFEKQKSNKSY